MFESYKTYLKNEMTNRINQSLEDLGKVIDENTPTDTKTLIGNNTIEKAKAKGSSISGNIHNDTDYAVYIEYGVGKPYKYHKGPPRDDSTVFYVGAGCRFFTRSYDNLLSKMIKRIKG